MSTGVIGDRAISRSYYTSMSKTDNWCFLELIKSQPLYGSIHLILIIYIYDQNFSFLKPKKKKSLSFCVYSQQSGAVRDH